jgi:hypothetical protein
MSRVVNRGALLGLPSCGFENECETDQLRYCGALSVQKLRPNLREGGRLGGGYAKSSRISMRRKDSM